MGTATRALLPLAVIAAAAVTWFVVASGPDALPASPAAPPAVATAPPAIPDLDDLPARPRARRTAPDDRSRTRRADAPPPTATPRVPLLVDVIHANGRPAILAEVRLHVFGATHDATTDDAGRARFDLNATKRADAAKSGAWIEVDAPAAPARKTFTTWNPTEAFRLVLEPSGAIVATLADARGPLVAGEDDRFVFTVGDETFERPVREGACVLQGVPIGQSATFAKASGYFAPAANGTSLDGPDADGAVVVRRVAVLPTTSLLEARLLGPGGAPLGANARIETTRVGRGQRSHRRTLSGGLLRMPTPPSGTIALRIAAIGRNGRAYAATTFVPPPRRSLHLTELGPVQLEATQRLVSGVVLQRDASAPTGWAPAWSRVTLVAPHDAALAARFPPSKSATPPTSFTSRKPVGSIRVNSDANGRFEIWGVPRFEAVAVHAYDAFAGHGRVTGLSVGRDDVVVRLGGVRTVRGRIISPWGIPRGLRVVAREPDGHDTVMDVAAEGTFRTGHVASDVVDLDVQTNGMTIARREHVPTSADSSPKRVEISLESAHWIRVFVRDAAGRPIADAVAARVADEGPSTEQRADAAGCIGLLAALAPHHVTVRARGKIPVTLSPLAGDRTVRLVDGISVKLRLPPGALPMAIEEIRAIELIRPGSADAERVDWSRFYDDFTLAEGKNVLRFIGRKPGAVLTRAIDVGPNHAGKTIEIK